MYLKLMSLLKRYFSQTNYTNNNCGSICEDKFGFFFQNEYNTFWKGKMKNGPNSTKMEYNMEKNPLSDTIDNSYHVNCQ